MTTTTGPAPTFDTSTDSFTVTGSSDHLDLTFHRADDEVDDISVRVDTATIVDSCSALILTTEAGDHCDHDLDDSYNKGHADATEKHDSATAEVMRRWHDDNHAGVVQFCYEQPCADLRVAVGA